MTSASWLATSRYFRESGLGILRITIDTAGASEALGLLDGGDRRPGRARRPDRAPRDRTRRAPAGNGPNALAQCLYGAVAMQTLGVLPGNITLTDRVEVDERLGALVDLVPSVAPG